MVAEALQRRDVNKAVEVLCDVLTKADAQIPRDACQVYGKAVAQMVMIAHDAMMDSPVFEIYGFVSGSIPVSDEFANEFCKQCLDIHSAVRALTINDEMDGQSLFQMLRELIKLVKQSCQLQVISMENAQWIKKTIIKSDELIEEREILMIQHSGKTLYLIAMYDVDSLSEDKILEELAKGSQPKVVFLSRVVLQKFSEMARVFVSALVK